MAGDKNQGSSEDIKFTSDKIERNSGEQFFERVSDEEQRKAANKAARARKQRKYHAKSAMRRAKAKLAKEEAFKNGFLGKAKYFLFYGWHKFASISVALVVIITVIVFAGANYLEAQRVAEEAQREEQAQQEQQEYQESDTGRREKVMVEAEKLYETGRIAEARSYYEKAIAEESDKKFNAQLCLDYAVTDTRYTDSPEYTLDYALRAEEELKTQGTASHLYAAYTALGDAENAARYDELLRERILADMNLQEGQN